MVTLVPIQSPWCMLSTPGPDLRAVLYTAITGGFRTSREVPGVLACEWGLGRAANVSGRRQRRRRNIFCSLLVLAWDSHWYRT